MYILTVSVYIILIHADSFNILLIETRTTHSISLASESSHLHLHRQRLGRLCVGPVLRWDSRGGSSPGPRDPGLQKPWIPGKDLGQGRIPQIYSNRLNFFAVPCPETSCHARCFPSLFEEFFFFQKNLFRRAPSRSSQG